MNTLFRLRKGDKVSRIFCGSDTTMQMTVTEVDDILIHCGPWTFDKLTGAEVDEDLHWGPKYNQTGSYLEL